MFKKRGFIYACAALMMVMASALSIMGPSILSMYKDTALLDNVVMEPLDNSTVGYRYSLTPNERLYILAAALENQILPQSSYASSIREPVSNTNIQNPEESYAFVKNYREPSDNELSLEEVLDACRNELAVLCELNVIPSDDYKIREDYEITLNSALDILESQKKVSVWQIRYTSNQQRAALENTLLDAYLDAETGKLYGFSIRIGQDWENLNPDEMMKAWCNYLGLGNPEVYEPKNPPIENTPYYKKYSVSGMGTDKTIVTAGFYKGIKELFFKVNLMPK